MPLIIQRNQDSPVALLSRPRILSVTGDVTIGTRIRARRNRTLTVLSGVESVAEADAARNRTLYVFGRVNAEPNEFGEVTAERNRTCSITPTVDLGGVVQAARGRTLTINARVRAAETDTLTILLTIANLPNPGFGNTYSARIVADGITYKIKSANYVESRDDNGVTLEVALLKPTDRAAIEAADSFKFEIYDGAAWVAMFDSGTRIGLGFAFTFADGRPADGLSVSTNAELDKQLNTSPERETTLYDSARATLTLADFPVVRDTTGGVYLQNLVAIPGLDLYSIFNYVFGQCGFDGFETTIPNFPIRRIDFSMQSSLYDGIKGHIGSFKPLMFVVDNVIWLIDSTAPFPAGFGSPTPLAAGDYLNAQFSDQDINIDGLIVQFSDSETDFDYSTDRFIDDPADEIGTFGSPGYTETQRTRTYRDYFKISNPFVPVRTEKIKEVTTVKAVVEGSFVTTSTETETLSFDTFGNCKAIRKEHSGLVPDLLADGFPATERTIKTTQTDFLYGPDRFAPLRQVLKQTNSETTGLITIDADNEHLGKPFKQEFLDGYEAGNLSATISIENATIETSVETIQQTEKRQIEIRKRTVRFLTDPPAVLNTPADIRAGDMSTNGLTGSTGEIIVLRAGSTRTDAVLDTLSVNQLPYRLAEALALRILERRKIRKGTITLKGLNLSIARGSMFELFDRDGFSVGVFVCEGRSISLTNLGTSAQASRQIIEVSEI